MAYILSSKQNGQNLTKEPLRLNFPPFPICLFVRYLDIDVNIKNAMLLLHASMVKICKSFTEIFYRYKYYLKKF